MRMVTSRFKGKCTAFTHSEETFVIVIRQERYL